MIQIASIKSQPQDTDFRIWLSAQAPSGSSPDIQLGQFSPSHRLRGEWQRGEFCYSEFSDQYAHELSQSWDELMLEEISAQASGRDVGCCMTKLRLHGRWLPLSPTSCASWN